MGCLNYSPYSASGSSIYCQSTTYVDFQVRKLTLTLSVKRSRVKALVRHGDALGPGVILSAIASMALSLVRRRVGAGRVAGRTIGGCGLLLLLCLLLFLVLGQEITASLGLGSEDHPEQAPDGHVFLLDALQDQDQSGDPSVE